MIKNTHVTNFILILLLITISAYSAALPYSFLSQKHPSSLLIKIQAAHEQQFRLKSQTLIPRGSQKTTLNTFGPKIDSSPSIQQSKILFNEQHQGKHILAFYDDSNAAKFSKDQYQFNFIQSQYNQQVYGHLLPMFSHELPSFRVDKLFKCKNTLVSVQWRNNDAHIVAFSRTSEQWKILENIDGGISGEDQGIRYAYAIDRGHTHPVVINMGRQHCKISRETVPAKIQNTWNQELYSLEDIINLTGESLELQDKLSPTSQEL